MIDAKSATGIFPMLYAFFDGTGELRLDCVDRQVDAVLAANAAGVAVLGLATEVRALTPAERHAIIDRAVRRLRGRKPLIATVFGETPSDQITFARTALDHGANALVLQPPPTAMDEPALLRFFGSILDAVTCPCGIQNAPEFLGYGLSHAGLSRLAADHPHFVIAKLECSAVNLAEAVTHLGDKVAVFNGRCGLEMPDTLRAGASGLIPGIETCDHTTAIHRDFAEGDVARSEQAYADILPTLCFIMQGIPHLVTYGKIIAAHRLGIDPGGQRHTALAPTPFGLQSARRFADRLGPLAH